VYRNKRPVDLPRNPALDITTDPVRALRRMLLKLKATSRNMGPTGASAVLAAKPQRTNTAQQAAAAAATVAAALRVGRRTSAAVATGAPGGLRNRASSVDTGMMGPSGGATAVATVSAAQEHVLTCELAVLLSWIWDSYWPNGQPLSELEEEEVNERFQDWAKIIQRQRAAEVFDVELDADDLDAMGDFGTTFNVFAGWFMMLVEYLLKVRRLQSGYDGDADAEGTWADPAGASVEEDTKDEGMELLPPDLERRLSIRRSFLQRRVQEYPSPGKARPPTAAQLEVVDLDAEPATEEAKAAAVERRVMLRERFLRRRVQGYQPPTDPALAVAPVAHDSLKDAYFGHDAPPAFDFQIDAVDLQREMAATNKEAAEAAEFLERAMNNRKRFLQRRVQEYV